MFGSKCTDVYQYVKLICVRCYTLVEFAFRFVDRPRFLLAFFALQKYSRE